MNKNFGFLVLLNILNEEKELKIQREKDFLIFFFLFWYELFLIGLEKNKVKFCTESLNREVNVMVGGVSDTWEKLKNTSRFKWNFHVSLNTIRFFLIQNLR